MVETWDGIAANHNHLPVEETCDFLTNRQKQRGQPGSAVSQHIPELIVRQALMFLQEDMMALVVFDRQLSPHTPASLEMARPSARRLRHSFCRLEWTAFVSLV